MKQATLTFMSSHLATRKQQRAMSETFKQFDVNGDGVIQKDEFLNAYRFLYPNSDGTEVDERASEVFNRLMSTAVVRSTSVSGARLRSTSRS